MSVVRLLRRIIGGDQLNLAYIPWNGSTRRKNNPVHIADHLLTRLPPVPAGYDYVDSAEYQQNEYWLLIKGAGETSSFDKPKKFPRHYFTPWRFTSVDSTMGFLRQKGLVDQDDMGSATEALINNTLEQPVLLLQAFVASEAVCKSEPYVRFLDGRGHLDIGRFVQCVTPKSPRYYELQPDIDYLRLLFAYSNASEQRRKRMLRGSRKSTPWRLDLDDEPWEFGSLFVQSLRFSMGEDIFEDGRLPSEIVRSAAFSGTCRKDEGGVTVEMGTTEWYLHYEAVKEAATRLQTPTLFVAQAIKLAGISSCVNHQGRIFYDAAVVNGFRYNDKRLFAGLQHKDLAVYSEYVGFGFTPWTC